MAESTVDLPDDVPGSTNKLRALTGLAGMPATVLAEVMAVQRGDGNVISPSESASATTPGSTPYCNTALSNTKQAVKAGAGNLWGYHLFNPGAVTVYVQFFDALVGAVTVGTTPPTWVLALPANSTSPFGVDNQLSVPIAFAAGLVIACTATSTGAGAPASAVLADLFYV